MARGGWLISHNNVVVTIFPFSNRLIRRIIALGRPQAVDDDDDAEASSSNPRVVAKAKVAGTDFQMLHVYTPEI